MAKLFSGFALVAAFAFLFTAGGMHAQSTDTTPPSMPGTPSASINQYREVQLSWGASTDDVGVVGYYVYRNGGSVGSAPNTSFVDMVPPGVYSYTVAAYDAAGNVSQQSAASNPISLVLDTTQPTAPTNLVATSATSSVSLSWTAAMDNVGVVGYYLTRNGVQIVLSSSSAYAATTYTDMGLAPGTTYTYSLVAYDAAGNVSNHSNSVTVVTVNDTTPPSVPLVFTPTVRSQSEIDFAWTQSTDNVGVVGYYLYRDGSQITSVSSSLLQYADTGLSPGATHFYTVAAYDAAQNISAQSIPVIATTFVADTIPPTQPNYFVATVVSASEIDLRWQASADNIGVTGYDLYQNGNQIANTSSTFFANTGLASGTAYTYTVNAYDAAGNVSTQATVSATTWATNPAAPAATTPAGSGGAGAASPSGASSALVVFTTTLSYGARNSMVTALQGFLIRKGYLGPSYATGFYGALTQKAVQSFQCDQAIVCAGTTGTTGWGTLGPKTRKTLNALF